MAIHIGEFIDFASSKEARRLLRDNFIGRKEFSELAPRAECFDFGPIDDNHISLKYDEIPHLTKYEIELFAKRLIPFPAPICWYEYEMLKVRMFFLIDSTLQITLDFRVSVEIQNSKLNHSVFGRKSHIV